MNKKLKVLLLFDSPYNKPRGYDFSEEFKDPSWNTERDVYQTLLKNGHEAHLLGIYDDLSVVLDESREFSPDVVFNLSDVFRQQTHLDKNVAWFLEMLGVPYTGAAPETLLICNNKSLSKRILTFHGITVPRFQTYYRHYRNKFSHQLTPPLIVKPLCEEASRGISLASFVDNETALKERIHFIHDKLNNDAIVEEYIQGRELYIGVIGNKRIRVMPPVEMKFGNIPDNEPHIATYRAKWDDAYRKKWGLKNVPAGALPKKLAQRIRETVTYAYQVLNIRGYARFDIRITPEGKIYILEPNANPCLARDDDFAKAAKKAGISYPKLIQKIVHLSLERGK